MRAARAFRSVRVVPPASKCEVEERRDYRLLGDGIGIHWPRIDEDLSVVGLLRGTH
jgi:hypothetical protein